MPRLDVTHPVNKKAPLNRGLVSWWLNLPNRHGGGGQTFRDLCGRNHATLNNAPTGPTWWGRQGRPGGWGALDFDGVNDNATVAANSPSLTPLQNNVPLTVAMWFHADVAPNGFTALLYKGENSPREFTINFTTASQMLCYGMAGNTQNLNAAVVANRWYHLVAMRDVTASLCRVFIDGQEQGQVVSGVSGGGGTGRLWFGDASVSGFSRFNGRLDDVRIYNRALSAAELRALYNASRTGYRRELNWYAYLLGTEVPDPKYPGGGSFARAGSIGRLTRAGARGSFARAGAIGSLDRGRPV